MTTQMNYVTNHELNRKSNDEEHYGDAYLFIKFIHIYYWSTDNMVIEKKDESKLVDRAGKNYLNYTISYIIWSIVLVVITLIGVFLIATDIDFIIIIGFIITFIGILSIFAFSILSFVFTIIACVKYYNGQEYIIPLTIRFYLNILQINISY